MNMKRSACSVGIIGSWLIAALSASAAEQVAVSAPGATYDAHGKRDPFTALVRDGRFIGGSAGAFSSDASNLSLAGIMWEEHGRSIALINDAEARVGDIVAGYEVTAITRDDVTLSREGRTITLRVSFEGTDHRRDHP